MVVPLPPLPTFSPDFYSVAGIAARLREAGHDVTASADCAGDVYVLSLKNATVADLRGALEADGRLEWRAGKNPDSAVIVRRSSNGETTPFLRYLDLYRAELFPIYRRVLAETRYIQSTTPEKRARALEIYSRIQDKDPVMAAGNEMIRLVNADHDVPSFEVTIPERMLREGLAGTERALVVSGADILGLLSTEGPRAALKLLRFSVDDVPDDRFPLLVRPLSLVGRWRWDPVSGTATLPTRVRDASQPRLWLSFNSSVVPKVYLPTLDHRKLWEAAARTEYLGRVADHGTRLADLGTVAPDGSLTDGRLSDRVLEWARKTGRPVVAYVSPLSDFRVRNRTLPAALGEVNAASYVERGVQGFLAWTAGPASADERRPCLTMPARFTLGRVGDVTVVRNEIAFLDRAAPNGAVPLDALRTLDDGPEEAIRGTLRAAALLPRRGPSAETLASQWSPIGDPRLIRPFAALLAKRPDLLDAAVKGGLDLPLSKIGSTALNALLQSLGDEAAWVLHLHDVGVAATRAEAEIRKSSNSVTFVTERAAGGVLTLELRGRDRALWSASLFRPYRLP